MHIVYIDDSKDGKNICFSAVIIPADEWLNTLNLLVEMRRAMKESDGIYMKKELHATDWLGGRGNVAENAVPKGARARLYEFVLKTIANLPGIQIINAHSRKSNEMELFSRLLNRINKNVQIAGSRTIVFSDEGKNYDGLLRRMRRFNPTPSAYGGWSSGKASKNFPLERILEDIVYRDSAKSYFIQVADFCVYSLLRYENPTQSSIKYGIDKSIYLLDTVLVKQAFAKDPKGLEIVRV